MAFSVSFDVLHRWSSGFIGSITLTNAGSMPATGWSVGFDAPFDISNLWNGSIVARSGSRYEVRDAGWNSVIPPGGSITFGFQANATGQVTPPSGFSVNGQQPGGLTALPVISVGDVAVTEGATSGSEALFTIELATASSQLVSVDFSTANGTAVAGTDFAATAGQLTFAPGERSKVVRVPVLDDQLLEGDETFVLNLTNVTGASLGDAQAFATIRNDDVASIGVTDIAVVEGNSGTKAASFTVSLSSASLTPVSVAYETANGTAKAGTDYIQASGTLTFAPGETSKQVEVQVAGDTVVEASETFSLKLSNPVQATITDGEGIATVTNDDAVTLPKIRVADAATVEGDPGSGGRGAPGVLSTRGNQIVNTDDAPVKIAGVNWFGMESDRYAPDGLHTRSYKSMMDQMVELGFNTVRLPFSNQALDPGRFPTGIDYGLNPELAGLNAVQVLDQIVAYAGEVGLRIILDHHRSSAGAGASENGLWYNDQYSEARWISDWVALADRYADNPTVIGADLHNEPHTAARWGGGGPQDWPAAAERAGNAIHRVNPDWLIFVEGVGDYNGDYYWWGGNLMGVRDRPVVLDTPNKLVYSPHDYPNSIFPQPYFYEPGFPNNLHEKFEQMWGFIYEEGIAPVYLGEFGSRLTDPRDEAWFEEITAYLEGDLDGNGSVDIPASQEGISWTWWSWNPNSGDTGGILADDWRTVQAEKVDGLRPLMFDLAVSDGGSAGAEGQPAEDQTADFVVTLSQSSTETVSVSYETSPETADGSDFSLATGTLVFQPGETTKTISVAIRADDVPEPDERFGLSLFDVSGATIEDGDAFGLIDDDDGFIFPPPLPPTGVDELATTVTVSNDWGSGFVASVSVRNAGSALVDDWTLELEMPYAIVNIWNAQIVSRSGRTYVIENAAWNDKIAAGQEVSFGFQASPGHVDLARFDWG